MSLPFLYRESFRGRRTASVERQGIAACGKSGVVRRFARLGETWVASPGGLYTRIPIGHEPTLEDGIQNVPRALTSYSLRSAFISGTTGWTLTNNNGVIDLDTAEPFLFDGAVQTAGQQTLRFTAGNPNTVGAVALAPNTFDVAAIDDLSLKVWRRDDSNVPLEWALYSTRAGKYWNTGTLTFNDVAPNWYALTATAGTTDFEPWGYAFGKGITVSPDYIRLYLRQANGGTASRVNHVAYAAVHRKDYTPGIEQPIPTDNPTAAVTRWPHSLMLSCATGMAGEDCGTIWVRIRPDFDAADLEVAFYPFLVLCTGVLGVDPYVAAPYIRAGVEKEGGGTYLRVEANGGGGVTAVDSAWSVAEGAEALVAIRYTSAANEKGLGARRLSLFLDGVVLDSDALADDLFSGAAPHYAHIGGLNLGGDVSGYPYHFPGAILDLAISPDVAEDTIIQRWGI